MFARAVRSALAVGLAVLPVSAFAWCGATGPVYSNTGEGKRFGLFIAEEQINKTEAWSPGQGEPPLSVAGAYRVAAEWGKTRYSRYDAVDVNELVLLPYGCSAKRDRWYYRITLEPMMEGNRMRGSGNFVAVLFDGTVIAPKEY